MPDISMEPLTLGTIICRFTVPQTVIDEINNDYDNAKDLSAHNNNLAGSQRNSSAGIYSEHQATFYLYSDNNNVFWRQNTDGVKTVNLYTYNDGNNVTGYQSGYATHNANISLTGSSPTTLNLSQQGNSAQSYSLSQNCQTMGGCSISVAQQ